MNRIPCGGFNIGDGLSVDPVTRTLSALGGSSSTNIIHLTWNEDYSQIVSADKTISEILEKFESGVPCAICDGGYIFNLSNVVISDSSIDSVVAFCAVNAIPSLSLSECDLLVYTIEGVTTSNGDVWSFSTNSIVNNTQRNLVLRSSTTNNNKKFAIQVDDSGTISATEVIE